MQGVHEGCQLQDATEMQADAIVSAHSLASRKLGKGFLAQGIKPSDCQVDNQTFKLHNLLGFGSFGSVTRAH